MNAGLQPRPKSPTPRAQRHSKSLAEMTRDAECFLQPDPQDADWFADSLELDEVAEPSSGVFLCDSPQHKPLLCFADSSDEDTSGSDASNAMGDNSAAAHCAGLVFRNPLTSPEISPESPDSSQSNESEFQQRLATELLRAQSDLDGVRSPRRVLLQRAAETERWISGRSVLHKGHGGEAQSLQVLASNPNTIFGALRTAQDTPALTASLSTKSASSRGDIVALPEGVPPTLADDRPERGGCSGDET